MCIGRDVSTRLSMAAAALAALVTGFVDDRSGPWILLVLPFMVAAVPVLAFGADMTAVVLRILLWGAATGVQDSTVKGMGRRPRPAPPPPACSPQSKVSALSPEEQQPGRSTR